jgi:DNA-binding CsgD family transcriptional regulator
LGVGDDVLVGREDEAALLRGLVAGLVAGVGGAVLVEGEQGIGKTTLLRASLAAAAGCQVTWAAADELGQDLPLGLITECLQAGERGERAGEAAAAPASSGPGIADRGAPEPGGSALVLAADPVQTGAEQLLALMDARCAAGPCVVVAEDLQWADAASVEVWSQLSRMAEQMPLLVVGSCWPAPGRDDLARLRRGLTERGGHVLSLGPLFPAQVEQVVAQAVGGRPGRRLAELTARTGGNALYARELAQALVRAGRIRVTGADAELDGDEPPAVPHSLAEAITSRLARLDEGVVRLLRWAVVLGPEFSAADLELVTGRPADEVRDALAQAAAAGVVTGAGQRLAFRHGLIRQVLHEEMPASVRAALHLRAARALIEAGATTERIAAQLAAVPELTQHWARDWLAGVAPVLIYRAPRVAAEVLRLVLAELADDDPRREAPECALVTVAFLLGRYAEVEQEGRRALARASDPDRVAEVSWFMAYALLQTGRAAEGAAVLAGVLERQRLGQVHQARLRGMQAQLLAVLGQFDQAAGEAAAAIAVAEQADDRFGVGFALYALSQVRFLRSDHGGRMDCIEQALAVIGYDLKATSLRLLLLSHRAAALDWAGRRPEALAAAEQAVAKAEQAGYPTGLARGGLAALYYSAGRWDDALAELELIAGLPGPAARALEVHGYLALIAVHRDQQDDAHRYLAAVADQRVTDLSMWVSASSVLRARALAAERAGSAAHAVALLTPVLNPAWKDAVGLVCELTPLLTRLALAIGDDAVAGAAASAATAAAAAEREDGQRHPWRIGAAADHCRGLVAGDPAPLLAAARYYELAGAPVEAGFALEDAAVLLAGRGETQRAREAFGRALASYEPVGATWDIRRAESRLRVHGIRRGHRPSPRSRPLTGWDALTPTEVKVAHLVARDRSNPDIAAELLLSRNTVQTHVSHILAKLGARSRTAIIGEALRHPQADSRQAQAG